MNNEIKVSNNNSGLLRRNRDWIFLFLLILIPFLVFSSGLNYPFMLEWDDSGLITENNRLLPSLNNFLFFLNNVTFTQMIYSPVLMYSLMFDRWLFGLNPMGFHIHNLLLHCASSLLLYGIARHLGVRSLIAFCVALAWAIHPQRVESIIWITERKDVLAGVFSFAAILVFMRSFDRHKKPYAAIIFLLFAMATKPSTLTLPGIMVVYAFAKRREWKSVKYIIPVIIAVSSYYVYSYIVCHTHLTGSPEVMPRLILVPVHNTFWYLITSVIPFEINPIYPRVELDLHTWSVLLTGLLLILLSVLLLLKYKITRQHILFNILPFVAAWLCLFLPVSAIMIRFTNTDYCDRYNYLLSAVVWAGIGMSIESLIKRFQPTAAKTIILMLGIFGIIIIYAFLTISYIPYWQDTKTFFLRAQELPVPNAKAIEGLGRVGLRRDDAEALGLAGNLFIHTSSLRHNNVVNNPRAEYYTGVFFSGMALLKSNQDKEALQVFKIVESAYYKKELELYAPEEYLPLLWGGLATCYLKTGQINDALRCLQNQLNTLEPTTADAWFCRGMIAFLKKDLPQARRDWLKANSINDSDPKILHNLNRVETLLKTSQPVKAE